LLDVGCGTGVLLHQLAALHSPTQLTGVDPVPEMLAVARRRLPAAIQLYQGWAERLPFQREQFDAVVSCNVFHYIREPAKALREMGRVLRPGGQLVITDWCDDYWACRVCDRCLRLFNRAHFKVYGEQECVQMLKDAGYALVKMDRYKITWLWGLMTSIATRNAAQPASADLLRK
jgi:ubiquinone/menaquinone biosynthesis C-methylase UbiE